MKVRVQNNIEVSDEQRVALGRLLDGPDAKKRQATREEIQDFAWEHGAQWPTALESGSLESPWRAGGAYEPTDEDLIGAAPAEDEQDLLGVKEDADEDLIGAAPAEAESLI